ncbi:hypothetical protein MKN04_21850 [Paenibacillus polymyxa]|uniref:hypothetical protein n=1 Tax=Paenibacillus polymyxa TaxID=1406 RepID=UPI0004D519BB|nr:hypothetical protein [Paenibacillus polymyxa]KEO76891.1 hypothetical protein EL23_20570 [Paenibacillus polymyxa]MCH6190287.1 hypothetical protein [Paenibacillus polymyxa]
MRQIKTPSRESSHVVRYGDNLGGVFALATRVSYPLEIKMKAINEISKSSGKRGYGAVGNTE